jgi:leader peptidase (prepilin peptidase)/N-methyltransferase
MWMVALSVIDVRERRLPNRLTLPGAAAIVVAAAVGGRGPAALAGCAALVGIYLLLHAASPGAMGAGDVKLAAGIGALTGSMGVDCWVLAALAAPVLTALAGIAGAVVGLSSRDGAIGLRRRTVPHGPSMCLAAAASMLLVAV